MSRERDVDMISASPQRNFVVRAECEGGRIVTIRLQSASIESVIAQVKARRIATPVGMLAFSVTEDQ